MANWADPTAAAFVTHLEEEWRWQVPDDTIIIEDLLDSGITVEVDPNDVLSNILAAFNTVASQETRELGKEICEQIIYCKGVLDRCVKTLIKIKEYDERRKEKQMIGLRLFPFIQQTGAKQPSKITAILLEMDTPELLRVTNDTNALSAKIQEAINVLGDPARSASQHDLATMFLAQPSRATEFCEALPIHFWWNDDILNLFFGDTFLGQVFPRMTSEERLSVYDKACLFDENLKLFYNRYQWHAAYLDVTLNPP